MRATSVAPINKSVENIVGRSIRIRRAGGRAPTNVTRGVDGKRNRQSGARGDIHERTGVTRGAVQRSEHVPGRRVNARTGPGEVVVKGRPG